MSKYNLLKIHLESLKTTSWRADFNDIEEILGVSLPRSARTYLAWWANQGGAVVQKYAWLDAGWRTEALDLAAGRVTFRRSGETSSRYVQRPKMPLTRPSAAPLNPADEPSEIQATFQWLSAGAVTLGTDGKLNFPKPPAAPGIYCFQLTGLESQSRYVGESDNLARRFLNYRNPGPTQLTNIRVNGIIVDALRSGQKVFVEIAIEAAISEAPISLERKPVRRLLENMAIVIGGGEDVTDLNL